MPDDADGPSTSEVKLNVPFKRGRAGRRRQRSEKDDEEDEQHDTVIKQPKAELKGSIQVSNSRAGSAADTGADYRGAGEIGAGGDMGATRALEENEDRGNDARARREAAMGAAGDDDGKYRGMKGYKDWREGFRRENKVSVHGPQRVSQHVRTTIRIDYQPDICKDYKETGFCSYGDTCKFLHDRGDYKSGWELDRDWEEQQKAKREAQQLRAIEGKDPDGSSSGDSDDEDALPFACFACRNEWKECAGPPVKTQCGHHLCEHCALVRHQASGKCPMCEKPLRGVFNTADDIVKKFGLGKGAAARPGQSAARDGGVVGGSHDRGSGWEQEADDAGGWS